MTESSRRPERPYLLEVVSAGSELRVSLSPVSPRAPTLRSYDSVTVNQAEIERLTSDLHLVLGRTNMRGEVDPTASEEVRHLGQLLFDELLPAGVKEVLRSETGSDLLLRADEALGDVPWELLHTGRSFLALSWNLGRLISARSNGIHKVAPPPVMRPPYEVLVLGDPSGDLDLAYREAVQVHSHLDGQTFLRVRMKTSDVSRSYVREQLREVDVLHFAGHAEIEGRGQGWLLSDGRLTAEDIERLRGGRAFPSLVFANACGSGQTSHRPTVGTGAAHTVARALIEGGVQHYLGTHWDVPDHIANHFAEHFYRALCRGTSIGEATRHARIALSVAYGEATILWGSYCLYGDPQHVYFPEGAERTDSFDLGLPIVDPDPPPHTAAPIFHTLDLSVHDLLNSNGANGTEGGAPRPHPELRSESAAIHAGSVAKFTGDLRRGLVVMAVVMAVVVSGVAMYEASRRIPSGPDASAVSTGSGGASSGDPSPPMSLAAAAVLVEESAEREAPPRLEFDVVAQTSTARGDKAEIRVSETTRLRSGDALRVHARSDRDLYIAVLMIDGEDHAQLLFPHPSARVSGGGYLAAGHKIVLPGSKLWYRLDSHPGTETLVIIGSRQPIHKLGSLVTEMSQIGREAMAAHGLTVERAEAGDRRSEARRSRLLGRVQSLIANHHIDAIQATTYTHTR